MSTSPADDCLDNFKIAMAELFPGDFPEYALEQLSMNACLQNADAIPSKFDFYAGFYCCYRRIETHFVYLPFNIRN